MRSKKALLNIATSLALQVVILICGFIVPKLIIINFGSNVNGLVTSITQFLAYISLLEAGFGPVVKAALYKPIAKKNKKQIEDILKASEKFFRVIALIFIVYLVLLSVIYPIIVNNEFDFIYTMSLVIIISISTIAEYFFGITYRLYLQAEQKTYITSIAQIIVYILNTLAIVVLVKLNCSIHLVKLVSGLIFILRPLAQNIYVKKKYKLDLNEANKNYELKQKWDGLAQHIAAVVYGSTDVTILTIFTNIKEVSVYSVYSLIVKGIKNLVQALTGGVDAAFGNMYANNEQENLKKSFKIYEFCYFTAITIIFTCTMILIVPFVQVYTKGITDVNYSRIAFGYLIVISEYLCATRLPYSSLALAAGHFKETRNGAWIETITNIVLSVILVSKFGIIGVTIGTIVAILIRTIEFMYHSSKYILKRKQIYSYRCFTISILEIVIINLITFNIINKVEFTNYIVWIQYAILIFMITFAVVICINSIIYREQLIQILKRIKRKVGRVKKCLISYREYMKPFLLEH